MDFPGEIGLGLGIVIATGSAFYVIQSVFNMATTIQNRYVNLLPVTMSSPGSLGPITITQDPSIDGSLTILPSDNERTGIEFSYSYYLLVNEPTFSSGEDKLYCVFYKGYDNTPWPLNSPGVYIKGDTNTMRIIFSSFENVYNYIDIENIPIGKWFHVVLNFTNMALEVHINGKLTQKLMFTDSLPYTNYGNIILFSNTTKRIILPNNININFAGAFTGMLSNLVYTRYALSFGEIQKLYNAGPTQQIVQTTGTEVSSLANSWFTQ